MIAKHVYMHTMASQWTLVPARHRLNHTRAHFCGTNRDIHHSGGVCKLNNGRRKKRDIG